MIISKQTSFYKTTGNLLIMILGLPVCLFMLGISVYACVIFGCSLYHVVSVFLASEFSYGTMDAALVGDAEISITLLAASSFFVFTSFRLVIYALKRGVKQKRKT
jgi:hypothetical protein